MSKGCRPATSLMRELGIGGDGAGGEGEGEFGAVAGLANGEVSGGGVADKFEAIAVVGAKGEAEFLCAFTEFIEASDGFGLRKLCGEGGTDDVDSFLKAWLIVGVEEAEIDGEEGAALVVGQAAYLLFDELFIGDGEDSS